MLQGIKHTNHNCIDAVTLSDKLQKLIYDFLIVFFLWLFSPGF